MNTAANNVFERNFVEALRFDAQLADGEDVTTQTFDESKAKRPHLSRVRRGPLKQQLDELAALNRQGAGVFMQINRGDNIVYPGARTCRTNRNVTSVRALFVDLDGSPIEPVLSSTPAPHVVVESSPGRYHAYWRCNGVLLSDFKRLQLALAKRFAGDPSVCDLARVMRIPGFYHMKNAPFMTRLVWPR